MKMVRLGLAALALAAAVPAMAQTPPRGQQQQQQRAPAVPADPITERNLTRDGMKLVYEAAKLSASIDADGDLAVKDGVTTYVFVSKDRIRLMVTYGFKPEATLQQKLELANRINEDYIVVRATVVGERKHQLKMDYYILIGSGMSKATLVAATRRFASIVPEAVKEHDTDDIVK